LENYVKGLDSWCLMLDAWLDFYSELNQVSSFEGGRKKDDICNLYSKKEINRDCWIQLKINNSTLKIIQS
jgi:hypothetical protein